MEDKSKPIFVDSGALIALYVKNDQYHKEALAFWKNAKEEKLKFLTSNFIFDEATTWMLYKGGKEMSVDFGEYILSNSDILPIKLILPEDEKTAWELFKKLPVEVSYTDCTSFGLMKRLDLVHAFTFDKHFIQAGFQAQPP
ncbi:hypothetical protein A2865_00535 [Candidatus Woesebacteria bacterium RIFCSPHIGHO2_01_FULL_39_17]|uniref:PilT protein domain protein n=2 Tax=Candidatus Woeseibacteriota TaxID=1752722 RepID=A0A0G0ND40_9BACT|nr:MAG: PilT domain-containing protein [Microgenomates group bacterium GW2011_GWC1_38_12]KKR14079.1 MAG: PilT protein domain protein [Candidatus Woesebacteria bacterium GW2011_GWA1_39_21b]OGM23674.1 MAG: hypothetical protein A2865_00535 [Candidatus Woesebacteria bacterium RIFCSPHIGHO2_01_FULL_39_17]OGM64705.1 MAG: hypothetical protein A3A52_04355 [Candidatus Woesebacteria bacterium RIFCSPLOWO2_01_FULL_39_14]